jgi:hypothetical protein
MNNAMQIYQTRAGEFKKEAGAVCKAIVFYQCCPFVVILLFAWFVYSAFKVRFQGYDLLFA